MGKMPGAKADANVENVVTSEETEKAEVAAQLTGEGWSQGEQGRELKSIQWLEGPKMMLWIMYLLQNVWPFLVSMLNFWGASYFGIACSFIVLRCF